MRRTSLFRTSSLFAFALLASAAHAGGFPASPPDSTTFPNAPVDYTTSAAAFHPPAFQWNVTAALQPVLAASGSAKYDKSSGAYTSGLLTDLNYQVGLSGVLTQGSAGNMNGVPVGSAGTIVSDKSFTSYPAGFSGPAGTREVYSQILSLDFTDGSGMNCWLVRPHPKAPPPASANSSRPPATPIMTFPPRASSTFSSQSTSQTSER